MILYHDFLLYPMSHVTCHRVRQTSANFILSVLYCCILSSLILGDTDQQQHRMPFTHSCKYNKDRMPNEMKSWSLAPPLFCLCTVSTQTVRDGKINNANHHISWCLQLKVVSRVAMPVPFRLYKNIQKSTKYKQQYIKMTKSKWQAPDHLWLNE